MKVSDLIKKSKTGKEIYDEIVSFNKNNPSHFKFFIPHFEYVSSEAIFELIQMVFSVSEGEWFRGDKGLIIQW